MEQSLLTAEQQRVMHNFDRRQWRRNSKWAKNRRVVHDVDRVGGRDISYLLYNPNSTKGVREQLDAWLFLDDKERDVAEKMYEGYNQVGAAEILGVSRATVCRRWKSLKSKLLANGYGHGVPDCEEEE